MPLSRVAVFSLYLFSKSNSLRLIANKSFVGTAKVVVATIKTHADKTPYIDEENGGYVIVNISTPKLVTVESSLSIRNIEPTFKFLDDEVTVVQNGEFYIPAINRNASSVLKALEYLEFQVPHHDNLCNI